MHNDDIPQQLKTAIIEENVVMPEAVQELPALYKIILGVNKPYVKQPPAKTLRSPEISEELQAKAKAKRDRKNALRLTRNK